MLIMRRGLGGHVGKPYLAAAHSLLSGRRPLDVALESREPVKQMGAASGSRGTDISRELQTRSQ
jgi:hypothetical protein